MPKYNPSQYECDNLEDGDMIIIKDRTWLYKIVRKIFSKNKLILRIKNNNEEVYAYQEDCILMYDWDLKALQILDNEIPCLFSNHPDKAGYKSELIKSLRIGTLNIQIVFRNNKTITIPVSPFIKAIKKNEEIIKNIKDTRMVKESIKYLRYKGDYFKNYVKQYNITKWIPNYCYLCGNPIVFEFTDNKININNQCTCGKNKLSVNQLDYDEFAIWYAGNGEDIKKYYSKFWFQERTEIKNNE